MTRALMGRRHETPEDVIRNASNVATLHPHVADIACAILAALAVSAA